MHLAAELGNLEILQMLVDLGGGDLTIINKQKFTPLHIAARIGHVEMVKWILSKGVDP